MSSVNYFFFLFHPPCFIKQFRIFFFLPMITYVFRCRCTWHCLPSQQCFLVVVGSVYIRSSSYPPGMVNRSFRSISSPSMILSVNSREVLSGINDVQSEIWKCRIFRRIAECVLKSCTSDTTNSQQMRKREKKMKFRGQTSPDN